MKRLGTQKNLELLPFYALLKILTEVGTRDLIQLSRVSKGLRRVLLNPSSRFIWRRALDNIEGLPPCPPDLTEPHYTNLLFDPFCDICLVPRVTEVYWACQVKCCIDCMLKKQTHFLGFGTEPYPYERYVPSVKTFQNGRLFRPLDIREFNNKRLSFFQDTAGETSFLEQCAAMVACRDEHAEACRIYQLEADAKTDVGDARSRRKKAIIEKLKTLGWSAEIAFMDEETEVRFLQLPEINRPRDLTDRSWETIKKNVLNFMEIIRTKRTAYNSLNELTDRISIVQDIRSDFVSSRPIDEPQPCLADLCCMEGFRDSLCLPSGQPLTEEIKESLRLSVPRLCERWRQCNSNKLVDILPPSQNLMLNPQHRLALATSFFKCQKCQDPIGYPRILVHRCLTSVSGTAPQPVNPAIDFHGSLAAVLSQKPWSLENDSVTFYDQASEAAWIVVEAAGVNPSAATARAMNKQDSWFFCSLCSTGEGELEGLLVMSWDAAVSHSVESHEGTMKICDWFIADSSYKVLSGAADVLSMISFSHSDYACYRCGLHMSFELIPGHMENEHQAVYDHSRTAYDDCYRHLDAMPPKAIRLRPETFSC